MNTIISVNSLLFRNLFGFIACLGIFIGATLYLANIWPPVINFEWFFLPVLSLVSLTGIFCFSLWIFFPRNFKIKIDEHNVQIFEKPYFKTNILTFDATKIVSINHIVDGGSFIKMNNGKEHRINDTLMIKKAEIFKNVVKFHPHIKTPR